LVEVDTTAAQNQELAERRAQEQKDEDERLEKEQAAEALKKQ